MATYLITFVCYGCCLPGQPGAVDRHHNVYGGRLPEVDPIAAKRVAHRMPQRPYRLDESRRGIVVRAMQEVCSHRGWTMLAAHVRTAHAHVVVDADQSPERVLSAFKAYASRALHQSTDDGPGRWRWARHGSTRYLWTAKAVSAAVHYVVCEQGEPMAVYEAT